jgi:hypothetical protein
MQAFQLGPHRIIVVAPVAGFLQHGAGVKHALRLVQQFGGLRIVFRGHAPAQRQPVLVTQDFAGWRLNHGGHVGLCNREIMPGALQVTCLRGYWAGNPSQASLSVRSSAATSSRPAASARALASVSCRCM